MCTEAQIATIMMLSMFMFVLIVINVAVGFHAGKDPKATLDKSLFTAVIFTAIACLCAWMITTFVIGDPNPLPIFRTLFPSIDSKMLLLGSLAVIWATVGASLPSYILMHNIRKLIEKHAK